MRYGLYALPDLSAVHDTGLCSLRKLTGGHAVMPLAADTR